MCTRNLGVRLAAVAISIAAPLLGSVAVAERPFIIVQSTTSTQNSGLLDAILPVFEAETGIDVRVVAVGTGQALKNAANGDGDVVLVHARAAEEKFVAAGFGIDRRDVMYNDFVLLGPGADPAGITGLRDAPAALRRIAAAKAPFVSRGDDSGTHRKELALWEEAGVDARAASGTWYRETGSGMGATLNTAVSMGAYVMSDRATWVSFRNRGDFAVLVEGDPRLFNQYGVMLVNPARHSRVKVTQARAFIEWLTGPEGQAAIARYRINGEPLFHPNAGGGG